MKTAGRENPNRWGPQRPATELMPRQVRTDLVRSSGLRSKKNSSRKGRCFFLTSAFIERLRKKLEAQFGPEYGDWVAELGKVRKRIRNGSKQAADQKKQLHELASKESFRKFQKRRKR